MDNSHRALNVSSEIGKLKTVLLHRPGKELENLMPDYLDRLLFDDIPYLKIAQEEHDKFAKILKENGVEVVYLEELAAEAIEDESVRERFVEEFLNEANVLGEGKRRSLKEYFKQFNSRQLIDKVMQGVRKTELPRYKPKTLTDMVDDNYPFLVDPMPNLYFTRDPFATIGTGITLNHMKTETRNRETIFAKYIFENHPRFKGEYIPIWFNRDEKTSLEGGDELILNKKTIAIGISERTEAASIEKFAKNILNSGQTFEQILAFDIPKKRAFMHLDTVFTMVDYDKFTIHPQIEGPLTVYSITKSKEKEDELKIVKEEASLEDILKKYLGLEKVTLIRCANGNNIDAAREQWNDGSNTLAIAPGEVIVYSRNYVTNKILEENGIKIHVMPSSELSRGRGGPRCMSMPLIREDIKNN
ncbi:arginine deiminase [Caldisalinibacter kiritimatiensis]|uniref:Arginine deiminase n=1 Tax=Caldisalinibacter kiritimatiensis TaxID=1304284 RepID=R1AVM2_9FIRM|nr:arginine deiminase [Caldisalinibacter kiritimatiensis]EOD00712.1 Arginine deiminase [Caldisalinibacter kiritimatiensis]